MYIYDGSEYTEEEIQNAADIAELSFEEYTNKHNITFEEVEEAEKVIKEVEEVDFPTSAVENADAVQQPITALQTEYIDTELAPVDTSLDLLDPINTFVAKKIVEKKKEPVGLLTFDNKKVNNIDLEKIGFEITETSRESRQGVISKINITAPNGESSSFDKNGGADDINKFIKDNSFEEDIEAFKNNKPNRNRFKERIKSLYNIDFSEIPAGELINNRDKYNDLKSLAVEDYNKLNIDSGEQGNMFGFGGKTALEAQRMSEYQIDKLTKEAVDEMAIAEYKENQELSNELLAKQINETGVVPEEYLSKQVKVAGLEIVDPNIKGAAATGNQLQDLRNEAKDIDSYSIESINFKKKIDLLKRKQDEFVENYTGNEAKYWLNNDLSIEHDTLAKEDENTLDITDKVVTTAQKILAMKASKGAQAVGIDFLRHRSDGRVLMDELNKSIDVSTKKYGGKATLEESFQGGSWQGALSQSLLKKNAEDGTIKGQQFDNFKNIKVKDLVDMYITSKGFMREGFGNNLYGVPAGYVPNKDEAKFTQTYDSNVIKNLADRYLNHLAEKKAFEVGYLANIDPSTIKRTGFWGAFGTSVAESFSSPEQVEKAFGPTNSEMLAIIENVASSNNIELTSEQENNFKETFKEFSGTAIGQAPKLAIQFSGLNAAVGGVLGLTGLGRYIGTLKTGKYFKNGKQISNREVANLANEAGYGLKGGKATNITSTKIKDFLNTKEAAGITKKGGGLLDKASALGFESVIEGVKMETLFEDGFNTGLMFLPASKAVSALFKTIPKFNFIKGSTYHRLNELVFKPSKSGLSLVPASEGAAIGEAVIDDFIGREDFKTYMDESFSEVPNFGEGSINRRLIGHFITGKALGYAHVNWGNVRSTLNSAKNMNAKALKTMMALVKDNGNPDAVSKRYKELKKSKILSKSEQKELENKAKFLEEFGRNQELYAMSQNYIEAGTKAMNETDPTIRAREAELEVEQYKKDYKKLHNEDLKLELTLSENGEGLDGKTAEFEKKKNGEYKIIVDQRKYTPGVIPHELGHMYGDIYKINNSEGMGQIKDFLESTVKEQLGQDIFKTIKEEYSKKTKQTEESFNEEYVMALIEMLGKGNSNLIRSNSFGIIKSKLQNLFNKRLSKVGAEPLRLDINTPEQLLNVLGSIASGKNVAAKYKALSNLIINGNKVFKNTGEVVGVTGGLENANRISELIGRQTVLTAKEKRTEAEEKEFQQNIVEIQEGVSKASGKKASVDLDEFTKELEDKLYNSEIDEYAFDAELANFKAKQGRKSKEIAKPKKEVDLKEGEIKVFHGGSIKAVKDIKGFAYFSENKSQAAEYAKGNEGKINSFVLNEKDIANESVVYKKIKELNLKSKEKGFEIDELNLYELIDPSFETSLSKSDLATLSKSLNKEGIKAVRFLDMNLKSLKNDISNIVVIDKSIINKREVDLDDVIVSDTKLDDLAIKYQKTPEKVSREEKDDLQNQYTKLAVNSLQRWAYSGGRKIPIKEAMKDPEIQREILQEIALEFKSVIKNYKSVNPETGVAQKLSTYIGNTVARRVGPKVVERYAKDLQNVSMSSGVGESFTSSESADQYVQEGEEAGLKRKINPLKFDVASQKTLALNEAVFPELVELQRIKNKTAENNAKIEEVKTEIKETITPDYIEKKIAPKVGEVLFDIEAKKLTEANVAVTYAEPIVNGVKQLSEAKKIQTYFSRGQNAENYIKILPEFNVSRTEAETSNALETILVGSDIKGRSILKANNLKKYFYEKYIDPKSKTDKERAITDPSGRSKGKKVQTGVVRLKPQFRGKISSETVQDFLTEMGITPSGEMNIPPSKRVNGKDLRSVLGRFLLGNAKLLSNLTANKIARQKIESFEENVSKEIDQILANIKSATSPNMASIQLDAFIKKFVIGQGYKDIKQYLDSDQEIKTITSEIGKNLLNPKYLQDLTDLHGVDISAKELLKKVSDVTSGKQTFTYNELVKLISEQKKFSEFLPKEIAENRGLAGFIVGRQYRNDLKGFTRFGEKNALKKVVNEKGEEMLLKDLKDARLYTEEFNALLDMSTKGDRFSSFTKSLQKQLQQVLAGKKLESITYQKAKTLKNNLKKSQNNTTKQAKIIKDAVNDKINNEARELALNLLNSLKVDYVQSTEKGSPERKAALIYMTRLAISTSNIHYGEKSLVKIVGGVTGTGEFYLEHLDTATKTGLRGLDNIYFNKRNTLQSRAILVPKSFAKKMDKKISKTSFGGMLRLIPYAKTNNILIENKNGKVVNFKKYLSEPNTWTINDLKAHDDKINNLERERRASVDLSAEFNKIIEKKTGVKAGDVFSDSRGTKEGKNKGRFDFFIPPSAEDFVGLLYKTLGKGKEGDAQLAWYKKNLLDPFARGDAAVTNERNALMRDFKQIKKEITEAIGGKNWKGTSPLTKKTKDKLPGLEYTGEDGLRMYIWAKQGNEIPGIDKAEVDAVIKEFVKNPELIDFANRIIQINKGTPYPEPTKNWVSGSVSTDLLQGINTTKRAEHLEQWQANVDQIFSKENLNKLEGVYGKSYRSAMEDMLRRMKTGRNRDISGDYLGGRVTDWVNNSTGAIMFFNQRSAVLQLISASNFVNMSDNNVFKAGTAFANQPQYWKDFKMLFNSEYLKNRRGGLEFNVTESEIADIAKAGGVNGVIAKILKVGFTPTQLADSFAIASGGSTFFRNRYKTYLKETNAEGEKVYTEAQAKEKAFLDFKETAEESQQSSRPDKISQQQAGILGRTVLSFANTPSQYARIIKKSAMDLKAGRGDSKSHISKIVYYSFLQNLLFNGLQKSLFMEAMGDEDDETSKSTSEKRKAEAKTQDKYIDIANGMVSSIARGTGVGGNIVNSLKDMGLEIYKQQGKTVQDYDRVADAALGFSPPIRYKYSQIKSAGRKFTYPGSRQMVIDKGFSIDNPALMAGAQVTSALTNIPLDRALKKINNIVDSQTMELDEIQRLGLLLGWSRYDLNIPKDKLPKAKTKSSIKNPFKQEKFNKGPKFKK